MSSVSPLLVLVPLHDGESLLSLVQRHGEANESEMAPMLKLVTSDVDLPRAVQLADVVRDLSLLDALAARFGLAPGALSHLHLHGFKGDHTRLRQGAYELSTFVREPSQQLVCPACLASDGYARAVWDFVQAPVCTVHGTPLLGRCPSCTAPLKRTRSRLFACAGCGFDLRLAPAQAPVSERALAVARFVQTPRMLSAGLPEDSFPLDPQELSDILRLATLPDPGQPWDFALEGKLDNIPTEVLVRALDLVGSVMDGRHLDTRRLRPLLLRRWPYGAHLPPREQVRLLKAASLLLTIGRESSNLICYDSEESPDPSAGEVFGAAMPRLFTRQQVEQFLNVEPQFLDDLLRDGLTLTPPLAGDGHDMDEVLAIQRTLPDVMTFEAVDRTLGLDGVTSALVDLKLLPTLRDGHCDRLVHPASVAALLHRLWLQVQTRDAGSLDGVALSDARQFGFDDEQLGWVVAQALNGSLPILAWDAPFSLASLRVDRQRLEQLAVWPTAEPGRSVPPSELSVARLEYVRRYRQELVVQADESCGTDKRGRTLVPMTVEVLPVPELVTRA